LPYSASAAALPGAAETQASENLPPVILAGLQAYKAGGPDNAIAAWVRGSALDGNKEVLSEANMLHSIQGFYGAYHTFDLIGSRQLGARTRVYYLTLDFDKGPVFGKFIVYKADQAWVLVAFNFNTKDDVLPSNLPVTTQP